MATGNVLSLPRGGFVVDTSIGKIQVGAPPETIKDCMVLKLPNPTIYVIPKEMFDRDRGVNLAEVEFPAYYNFFILNRKVRFVCTPCVEKRLRTVFRETLLGPEEVDLSLEFVTPSSKPLMPNLKRECAALRTFHEIDQLFEFVYFDDDGVAKLSDQVAVLDRGEEFVFHDGGVEVARTPSTIKLPLELYDGSLHHVRFEPPSFGITVLGSSHGFDPSHSTCGVVLWLNGRGIMVDPPLHSSKMLKESGIPPRMAEAIILTHCHADHDAGVFQKIREEGEVTIFTTNTIMQSFVRKYSAIANVSPAELMSLFRFTPVPMDAPMHIYGGEIDFHYSIHTIPCIGFSAYCGTKSIFYSGDTRNEPAFLRKMLADGDLSPERANFFLEYGWHQSLILHEAGVPPIHTPISVLAALPTSVKARLRLIHTSCSSIPADSGLRIAEEGVEATISLDLEQRSDFAQAIDVLSLVEQIDLFRDFSLTQAKEILQAIRRSEFEPGQEIVTQGTRGDDFYIIVSGVVSVTRDGVQLKTLAMGEYFGEMALVTHSPRSATCTAITKATLLHLGRAEFLNILRGQTHVVDRIFHLARLRLTTSWAAICNNSVLRNLTNVQKNQIEAVLQYRSAKAGEVVWKSGDVLENAVLVSQGRLKNTKTNQEYGAGALIGCRTSLGSSVAVSAVVSTHMYDLVAVDDTEYFMLPRSDLNDIYRVNPGIRLSLMHRDVVL